MLNFPNAPVVNQKFNNWTWDGTKWTVRVNDDAQYNNVGRNLLQNSMFRITQRGMGPFTTTSTNTLDRWIMIFTLDTLSITPTSLSDADRSAIGDEAARLSLGATVTGNAGATALSLVSQRIEDVRRLAGKIITVSFWARSSTAGLKLGACIEQAFGAGGSPSPYVSGIGQAVTLSTSWARYNLTFSVPSISGKTLGTDGSDYTALMLWLSCSTTNATRAGNIGVQSGTFFLWGIQLEVGTVATPLEKVDINIDWANCQRYYLVGQAYAGGYSAGNVTAVATVSFPVPMRAQPTVIITGNSDVALTNPGTASIIGGFAFMGTTPATATGWSLNRSFTLSAEL